MPGVQPLNFLHTVKPPLTTTPPQRPPFYNGHFLADSPYTHSYFNLATTVTSVQCLCTILAEEVAVSYTFYWKMVPLKFRSLYPL